MLSNWVANILGADFKCVWLVKWDKIEQIEWDSLGTNTE